MVSFVCLFPFFLVCFFVCLYVFLLSFFLLSFLCALYFCKNNINLKGSEYKYQKVPKCVFPRKIGFHNTKKLLQMKNYKRPWNFRQQFPINLFCLFMFRKSNEIWGLNEFNTATNHCYACNATYKRKNWKTGTHEKGIFYLLEICEWSHTLHDE